MDVNGLNSIIKRYSMAEWMKKQEPIICSLQRTQFTFEDTDRPKVTRWKRCTIKINTKQGQE